MIPDAGASGFLLLVFFYVFDLFALACMDGFKAGVNGNCRAKALVKTGGL